MKKNQLLSGLLTAGVLAGSLLSVNALASDGSTEETTTPAQVSEQTEDNFRGRGRGPGMCFNLSEEDQKAMDAFHEAMAEQREAHQAVTAPLHEKLKEAIDSGDKTSILDAWKLLEEKRTEQRAEADAKREELAKELNVELPQRRTGRVEETMDRLEKATSEEEIKEITEELEDLPMTRGEKRGPGMGRGRGMGLGRGQGHGPMNGTCFNPDGPQRDGSGRQNGRGRR